MPRRSINLLQEGVTTFRRPHYRRLKDHPRHHYQQQQRRCISNFRIVEHLVRTQHTRDRPAGVESGRENELRLHVNQYIPQSPRPAAKPTTAPVTIIGAQANGFPKEVYEPLWDELYERLRARGREVRSIWIADMASQGRSGIINERLLGPDGVLSCWVLSRFSGICLNVD